MDMVHHLHGELREQMVDTIYDKKPLVREMFCQKDSELGRACLKQGIPTQRINLHNGFDLYKDQTYVELFQLFRKQRPKKIWVSAMCTLFCSWVDLNYKDRREVLEKHRRSERQMLRKLTRFLLDVLAEEPDTELFWEWPLRCRGWQERITSSARCNPTTAGSTAVASDCVRLRAICSRNRG